MCDSTPHILYDTRIYHFYVFFSTHIIQIVQFFSLLNLLYREFQAHRILSRCYASGFSPNQVVNLRGKLLYGKVDVEAHGGIYHDWYTI